MCARQWPLGINCPFVSMREFVQAPVHNITLSAWKEPAAVFTPITAVFVEL